MQKVNREMKVKALNGKEFYLVDVIAQILKYLKEEFLVSHLQRGGYTFSTTDFDWVITVPAIWKARGKQMMREAGYKVFNILALEISIYSSIYRLDIEVEEIPQPS